MRYHELFGDIHPAKRERPRDITTLYVYNSEWADMRDICSEFGDTEIVGVETTPIIPTARVEVLSVRGD